MKRFFPLVLILAVGCIGDFTQPAICEPDEDDTKIGMESPPRGDTGPKADAISIRINEPLVAFFGAQGFGANSKGGRGGRAVFVTNLNDSGNGSLRAALRAESPRTAMFRLAGQLTN